MVYVIALVQMDIILNQKYALNALNNVLHAHHHQFVWHAKATPTDIINLVY